MNWVQVSLLVVTLVSLGLSLILLSKGPLGLARRLDNFDARLQVFDRIERSGVESLIHSREAKEATVQLVASVNHLDGRFSTVGHNINQVGEAVIGLEPRITTLLAQGMSIIKDGIATEHGALRSELLERQALYARDMQNAIAAGFHNISDSIAQMRIETNAMLKTNSESLSTTMTELRAANDAKLGEMFVRSTESANTLNETAQRSITTVTDRLSELRTQVDTALKSELGALRTENGVALESMRVTVDEKLHATLEQRLGDSFKLVSERLEMVHRGLGEMQSLATGVGDLRKVLTNVKTRGTWGEVQLETLLDQMLTIDQYSKNVATKPGSAARVEFAIRFPGRTENGSIWLPIDAKFPLEDYQRLVDAQERVDVVGVEEAGKSLETRIRLEAKGIREKYIEPPHTTDFAVLYLPTEGLYAEVLRRPGLSDGIQRDCKILLCGPTTLAALLNSLQMGFRTLAIEKRSSEVWTVLGSVKAEFGKFGEALAHTKRKLEEASNSIDTAEKRNRVLTRKLSSVDELPEPEAAALLKETVVTAVDLELSA